MMDLTKKSGTACVTGLRDYMERTLHRWWSRLSIDSALVAAMAADAHCKPEEKKCMGGSMPSFMYSSDGSKDDA